uniref:plasmid partitioning protein RepB n=1 Tax=Mesorhizobium sp. WSM4875 TaxID=3038539 RepID=UPI0024167231|nr:plasmid partitioning protein RepB [Mesorhizobium sp. WSM4875]WIE94718.1 plasmid partitioning protein RepB [Mesorhizobium sp. WSM4875]
MSRKNLLSSLTDRKLTAVNSMSSEVISPSPAQERNRSRGAFGAITRSIDELAEKAQAAHEMEARLLQGAVIVELDPDLIDASFIADRMGDDEQAFGELLEAIRENGQRSPILVRPHPKTVGRYMIVFGHRRCRVAKILGRKINAVVRDLEDRDHVIAQGQENSARADLSFIEKAVFASGLGSRGYDRDVIMQALSVDKTVVSKMISVASDIPAEVVDAIGSAKNSGRDRWYKLAVKLREKDAAKEAERLIESTKFKSCDSDDRLVMLINLLDKHTAKSGDKVGPTKSWVPADKSVSVALKLRPKGAVIEMSQAEARPFAEWISSHLDSLFEAYREQTQEN